MNPAKVLMHMVFPTDKILKVAKENCLERFEPMTTEFCSDPIRK